MAAGAGRTALAGAVVAIQRRKGLGRLGVGDPAVTVVLQPLAARRTAKDLTVGAAVDVVGAGGRPARRRRGRPGRAPGRRQAVVGTGRGGPRGGAGRRLEAERGPSCRGEAAGGG